MLFGENCKKIRLLIELDGSSHTLRENRKKTRIRNMRYAKAHIPHIIIDIRKFRQKGMDWFEYIDSALAKYGIKNQYR